MLGLGNAITLGFSAIYGPELHTNANAASDPNGNEVDATTGFSQIGLDAGANVFESQAGVKNVGSFSLHADANDTPTAAARFELDLSAAPFSCENGKNYTLFFDWRHIGAGTGNADWGCRFSSASGSGFGETAATVVKADTTFESIEFDFTYDADHKYLAWKESNANNNGGCYADNLSVKERL